jgi:hypothetical protein
MSAIYVGTSIVGYLTARSAPDVVFQACQELTRRWWKQRREGFDLYISQLMLDEAGAGDPSAAADRLRLLEGLPLLGESAEADRLADFSSPAICRPQKQLQMHNTSPWLPRLAQTTC